MPRKIPARIKESIRSRAKSRCEYCLSPEDFSTYNFSADHIIPSAKDGNDDLENLAFSCQGCNSHKYDKIEAEDPATNEVATLFNPRKNNWNDHFSEIIGKTPTGRATVEALKLNRERLILLRKGLFKIGEHPPG
ncbi:MAG: HNH endonuclease [Saprospirales bacterium]|nr:HNH endonuclease [Saprospirales bacterium]